MYSFDFISIISMHDFMTQLNIKRMILVFQKVRLTSTFNIYVSWHCVADDTLKRTILSTPVSANFSVARSGMP